MDDNSLFPGLKLGGYNIECDLKFKNMCDHWVSRNYDDIWGDFAPENVSEALTHAKQEIERAKEATETKEATTDDMKNSIFNHLKCAVHDFENYLKAANGVMEEFYETSYAYVNCASSQEDIQKISEMWNRDAQKLISAIASFKLDDADGLLCKTIFGIYSKYMDEPLLFAPDYNSLYVEIGDAILSTGDSVRARRWYFLAGIDWEGLLDRDVEELDDGEKKERDEIIWWSDFEKNIACLTELSVDGEIHTTLINTKIYLDMTQECRNTLWTFLQIWGNHCDGIDLEKDEIWNISKSFAELTEKDIQDTTHGQKYNRRTRTETMVAWTLIKLAQYYHLLCDATALQNKSLSNEMYELDRKMILNGGLGHGTAAPIAAYFKSQRKILEDNGLEGEENRKSLTESILCLMQIITCCDSILYVLQEKNPNQLVGYYTGTDILLKVTPAAADAEDNVGRLAVMHVAYMNDPNEGKALLASIYGEASSLNSSRKEADFPYVFIKCFTPRIDDLPMWEMYGNHAKGCCIVTKSINLQGNANAFPIYNVCYLRNGSVSKNDNRFLNEEGRQRIEEALRDIKEIKEKFADDVEIQLVIRQLINRIRYLFKNADYSYEEEKRIIYSVVSGMNKRIRHTKVQNNEEIPLLYVLSDARLDVDEIILGPKFENTAQRVPYLKEMLERMNKEVGLEKDIKITYSNIEYR